MRFLLAGREDAWFFTRYNRGVNTDRRTSEHLVCWPADDRDVLWPRFLGLGILIDQLGSYFVLFNPRHPGGLNLLLRPQL